MKGSQAKKKNKVRNSARRRWAGGGQLGKRSLIRGTGIEEEGRITQSLSRALQAAELGVNHQLEPIQGKREVNVLKQRGKKKACNDDW